jgi:hypothetical protein
LRSDRIARAEAVRLLGLGAALLLIGAALSGGLLWLLALTEHEVQADLAARAPLILQDLLEGGMIGLVIAGPGIMLLGMPAVVSALTRRRPAPGSALRLQQVAAVLVLGGIAAYVVSRPIQNSRRAEQLRAGGYTQCAQLSFGGAKSSRKVWVHDAARCDDVELRRLLIDRRRDLAIDYLNSGTPTR